MSMIESLKFSFKKVFSKLKFAPSPSINLSYWLHRLIFYFFMFNFLIVLHITIFSKWGILYNNADSARYMLSALVQSEAAIFAIVITLSLVAVQLAAQSYSARITELFQNAPDLWILIITYIIAMIYGLGVLKLIDEDFPGFNPITNLEVHISFSYFLGIFAFIAIIPYIHNTLNLLKPSNVIKILSDRVTGERILSAIQEKREKKYEIDPILPIIDLIRGSLMRYDSETIITGLRAIENRINYIIQNEDLKENDKEKILRHIIFHFSRFGNLAISKRYERIAIEIVDNLLRNANIASTQGLDEVKMLVIILLQDFEKSAENKGLKDTKQQVSEALKILVPSESSN